MELFKLRQKHPRLIYQDFKVKPDGKNLQLSFNFLLEPDIRFRPEISIPLPPSLRGAPMNIGATWQSLIFNLGMIEALSYWKAACPPELIVKAGYLSPDQIAWWKHLFIHGLGEFFYRNRIDFTAPDFLSIVTQPSSRAASSSPRAQPRGPASEASDISIATARSLDFVPTQGRDFARDDDSPSGDLILVGGGKDSIVTLETLKSISAGKNVLMLNPGPNSLAAARLAGYENPIIITRKIDPKLLQLNKLGYLNGHTPFSAYLAFLGVLVAYLHGYKNVISSNELGAGEASLIYKSMEINHQYSKSFAFEKRFRDYCREYLFANQESHYFSFLRPLYELQIAKIFSSLIRHSEAAVGGRRTPPGSFAPLRMTDYDSIFISCNAGRGKFWCGRCPKCAFNYLSLFPFMSAERLKNIFKSDLFENSEIQKHILDLVGLGAYKPFDCVGTKDESILAAFLAVKKLQSKDKPIPAFLLQAIGHSEVASGDRRIPTGSFGRRNVGFRMTDLKSRILENWSDQNFLPPEYSKLLKELNEL